MTLEEADNQMGSQTAYWLAVIDMDRDNQEWKDEVIERMFQWFDRAERIN